MVVSLFIISLGSCYDFTVPYWESKMLSDNEKTAKFIMINVFNHYCLHVVFLLDAGCNLLIFKFLFVS